MDWEPDHKLFEVVFADPQVISTLAAIAIRDDLASWHDVARARQEGRLPHDSVRHILSVYEKHKTDGQGEVGLQYRTFRWLILDADAE